MITATFEPITDNNVVVGKRLSIFFNSKFVTSTDFPAEAEMDEDQVDAYIAGKFSGILS